MKKIIALILCAVLCIGTFAGCGGGKDAFVIMTEQLDGLLHSG